MLLRRHLRRLCLEKGLAESPDRRYLYFPPELIPMNRLTFTNYDGRRTWVQVAGERSVRAGAAERERYHYHLAPTFSPALRRYGRPLIEVRPRLYLTDDAGNALSGRTLVSRRKSIGRSWWNYEWLARLLAITSWLADGADVISLSRPGSRPMVLGARPLSLSAPVGIDESTLGPIKVDDVVDLLTRGLADEDVEEVMDGASDDRVE